MKTYIGVDVGSVSTKMAALDENDEVIAQTYIWTQGKPIEMIKQGLNRLREQLPDDAQIDGIATTGSARYLAGVIVGADLVKNEITTHAVASLKYVPDVQTVIEIGGQDSKIIIIRDGVVTDFGMNTVCAAGTGSFLDHQAERLSLPITEFSSLALESKTPVRIAGRCTVFAESDMIHKQQLGHQTKDIVFGLCQALVRNYLNNVGLGKQVAAPVVFQGGVSFNQGITRAFQEELKMAIIVPEHREIMGAIGAALLVHEEMVNEKKDSNFRGMGIIDEDYRVSSFECDHCPNRCEIAQLMLQEKILARWGGRCDRWERSNTSN